ncbi:MAG: hypothetical protein O6761_05050 [Thaumarchaeota archaeon]|nr:hypothetical protein [Nitrososphaerota archaeon]
MSMKVYWAVPIIASILLLGSIGFSQDAFALLELTFDKIGYTPSDVAHITLMDTRNPDSDIVETKFVRVSSETNLQGVTIPVQETGVDTNIFTGSVSFFTHDDDVFPQDAIRVSFGDVVVLQLESEEIPLDLVSCYLDFLNCHGMAVIGEIVYDSDTVVTDVVFEGKVLVINEGVTVTFGEDVELTSANFLSPDFKRGKLYNFGVLQNLGSFEINKVARFINFGVLDNFGFILFDCPNNHQCLNYNEGKIKNEIGAEIEMTPYSNSISSVYVQQYIKFDPTPKLVFNLGEITLKGRIRDHVAGGGHLIVGSLINFGVITAEKGGGLTVTRTGENHGQINAIDFSNIRIAGSSVESPAVFNNHETGIMAHSGGNSFRFLLTSNAILNNEGIIDYSAISNGLGAFQGILNNLCGGQILNEVWEHFPEHGFADNVPIHHCDSDDDGIADFVDIDPNTQSNGFFHTNFLGTSTLGVIVSDGEQILTIRNDHGITKGVRIIADPNGGAEPAHIIEGCNIPFSSSFFVDAGEEVVLTCGSITVEATSGIISSIFVGDDGTEASAEINEGNTLTFDPASFTMKSITGTAEVTIVADDGTIAEISLTEGNAITVDSETSIIIADSDNESEVTIIVDGEETTIPPGKSIILDETIDKVEICHKGKKTISVSPNAVDAHLSHDDELGACENEDKPNNEKEPKEEKVKEPKEKKVKEDKKK